LGQYLDGFHRLNTADHPDHRRQHPGLGAGFGIHPGLAVQAAVTGALPARPPDQHLPLQPDRRPGHQRRPGPHAGGVDRQPGRQVVAGIHHHVGLPCLFQQFRFIQRLWKGDHLN
jgi:hypothetical protein